MIAQSSTRPVSSPPRTGDLVLALALYGLFSTSTPESLGPAEATIGLLLALAVGPLTAARRVAGLGSAETRDPTLWIGWMALVYLAAVPTLVGVTRGWTADDLFRDILPLLYLFLPVLLAPPPGCRRPDLAFGLIGGLCLVGVCFAVRFLHAAGWLTGGFGTAATLHLPPSDIRYLPNEPAVLFAAVLLPLLAIRAARRPSPDRLMAAVACGIGGFVCLAALASTLQRGALGLCLIAYLAYAVPALARSPKAWIAVAAGGAVLWVAFGDRVQHLALLLALKSHRVGWNNHLAEVDVAVAEAGISVTAALIGSGWGAVLVGPAVPGLAVSYLHALPLYLLVKSGMVGLCLAALYIAAVLRPLPYLWSRDRAVFCACLAPLLSGLLLQPGFKTLSFGVLLCIPSLLWSAGEQPPKTRKAS